MKGKSVRPSRATTVHVEAKLAAIEADLPWTKAGQALAISS